MNKKTKLPLKYQILFGVGGMGENIAFQAVTAWLFFFWAGQGNLKNALLAPALLGLLLGLGRFIEAFDDPIIGHLSDITRSPLGRRFPYIFFGAPFLGLTFFLLWTPPQTQPLFLAIYFFVMLQLFFLFYTIVASPYEGILPEIATTSEDRVSTSAWRVVFGVLGAAVGLIGSSLLIEKWGYKPMGIILGIATMAVFWISIIGIQKKLKPHTKEHAISMWQACIATLKNSQFIIFSIAFILFTLGLNLLTLVVPYYVAVIVRLSEGWVAFFMGALLISMILSLPIYFKFAKSHGKKWTYIRSLFGLAVIFPLLAAVGIIPIGTVFIQLTVIVILIGLALAGQFVFPNAILADIIDYDATKTKMRREGMYYGMQNTLIKISFAAANIIFGFTLSVFGSTIDAPFGIRLIGPIAGITTFIGFIIFVKWYTLPDHVKCKI
ncbi:MFS transporter [Candidatus Margulisiibacteriota bacterium]